MWESMTTAECTGQITMYCNHLKNLQVISQYFQNGYVGAFGTDRSGDTWDTYFTSWTTHFNIRSCWIICEGLCKVIYNWKYYFLIQSHLHSHFLPRYNHTWYGPPFSRDWHCTTARKSSILMAASSFTQAPGIGKTLGAEMFLNFISPYPNVSSTKKRSNSRNVQVHHTNWHTRKKGCSCPSKKRCFHDVKNTNPPEVKLRRI